MTSPDEPRADHAVQAAWRTAASEQPAPALDAAILARARAAVAPGTRRRAVWPALVATAAVVVLGVQVLVRLPGTPPPGDATAPAARDVAPVTNTGQVAVERGPVDTASDRAWRAPQMPPAGPAQAPALTAERRAGGEQRAAQVMAGGAGPQAAPFPASAPPAAATTAPPVLFEQAVGPAADALRAAPAANDYDLRVEAIRAALQAGDTDGARALLDRLREAYPDRALPDDVAAALPTR